MSWLEEAQQKIKQKKQETPDILEETAHLCRFGTTSEQGC